VTENRQSLLLGHFTEIKQLEMSDAPSRFTRLRLGVYDLNWHTAHHSLDYS